MIPYRIVHCLLFAAWLFIPQLVIAQYIPFIYQVVNSKGTQGHELGDINGDGKLDIILAEGEFTDNRIFAWLEYPNWSVHNIDDFFLSQTMDYIPDLAVGDLDNDGDLDFVLPNSHNSAQKSLWWFENQNNGADFLRHQIYSSNDSHIKDVAVKDLDLDNRLDIVLRYESNIRIFFQNDARADNWTHRSQSVGGHEGMGVGDLNGDNLPDIIHNGSWLKNPGNRTSTWASFTLDPSGPSDSRVAVGDIDGDNLDDPVIGNSEGSGPIKWYKRLSDSSWTAVTVKNSFNGAHTMQIADMDRDGGQDIITGSLHSSTPGVTVYLNQQHGAGFTEHIVSGTTSYIGKVGDIDQNGAPDIMTSRRYDFGPMEVWFNQTPPPILPLNDWTYINIDSQRSDQPFGLTFVDINGDGYQDVLTGRNYYLNPGGNMTGTWAKTIVPQATDFKLSLDIDNDSNADVIGNGPDNRVRWYEADGQGELAMRLDAAGMSISQHPQGGQGYAVADIISGGKLEFVLNGGPISGNGDPHTIWYFTIPQDPLSQTWGKFQVAANATSDGLSTGDFDADGDTDITSGLGTDGRTVAWWPNSTWAQTTVGQSTNQWIDTSVSADFDGDGDIDIVMANEGSNSQVYLFVNNNHASSWTRQSIYNAGAENIASLSGADMDNDGDIDLVIGEHQGSRDVIILENQKQAASWNAINLGPAPANGDHHLGTRLIDLDNDGDLDIVSHGFSTPQLVHLWRNNAIGSASPLPTQPPPDPTNTPIPIPTLSQTDLVAYWPLDDNSGVQAQDASGNHHPLTLVNTAWSAGRRGGAVQFNGSSGQGTAGTFSVSGSQLTLAAWVFADSLNGDARIISKTSGDAEQDHLFMISLVNNQNLRARLKTNNSTTTLVTNTPLPSNQWVHMALTYDGNVMRLFQNGQEVGSQLKTGTLNTSSDTVYLGSNPASNYWHGKIDDPVIFNRALSPQQLEQLMASGPNLPVDTDLDNDSDTDWFDLSLLITNFNQLFSPANFNISGLVDIFDFNTLIQHL